MKLKHIAATALFALMLHGTAMASSAQTQALEASIREARAMGMDANYISQMEQMLQAIRADEQANAAYIDEPVEADPVMQQNHFDVRNARSYSNCEQYIDTQASTFCASAVHSYILYTEVFARGEFDKANTVYAGHSETVDNLINYVDKFMTAPRR